MAWILKRHLRVDGRPNIPTLRPVSTVPEPRHQRSEESSDLLPVEALFTRLIRKTVPGHRGDDDVKGILSAATVGDRVGERPDHFVKFHERSGPAMTEYQWQGIGVLRSLVNKVNVEAVDVGLNCSN